jgi:hypothetical protein
MKYSYALLPTLTFYFSGEPAIFPSTICFCYSLIAAFDISRGHLRNQPNHAVLEIVLFKRVATAEATPLDVDRVGVRVFLGAVPRDESGFANCRSEPQGCGRGKAAARMVDSTGWSPRFELALDFC